MNTSKREQRFDCLVVGAGHGGAQVAFALRRQGFDGTIAMIGSDPELPYDRPALSKDYLAGKKSFDRLQLRPADFWPSRRIEVRRGHEVVALDPVAKRITLDDGSCCGYGALVWAAGGTPRRLACPGAELPGVCYLRDKADSDALRRALPSAQRVVIIGGGYIGLEVAAVMRELGKEVSLVETLDRVLARVAAAPVADFYQHEHRRRGVELTLGRKVVAILGEKGRAAAVELDDGHRLGADIVVVGIGILPSVGPLLAAGAAGGNGVEVDEFCRTSLPDVYCIGDCALMTKGFGVRIESVQNATDQALTAARAICAEPVAHDAVPWFWSNQFDLKLQTIGLNLGYDSTVLRGDPQSRHFSLVYLKAGAVIALDCINAAQDFVQGRKLVEFKARVDPGRLADPAVALKTLMAQATPAESL